MACLDTTVLIDLSGSGGRRRRDAAREAVRRLLGSGETLVTTRFNVAELLVGVSLAGERAAERAAMEALLRPLGILEFDGRAAETFGRLVALLRRRGLPIGDMDALIGSVCLASGHSILTRNPRHFARVPGLRVETY